MYKPRTLESFLVSANELFPVLLVTGPRQVGKTTLLKHMWKKDGRTYITLDDPLLGDLAKRDPALFLQRFPPPLLIDEIQYAPQLLPIIKMIVDENPIPGQFWLTGSQQFQLMKGVTESLAGRVGIVNLLGLSSDELSGFYQNKPFLPTLEQLIARSKQSKFLTLRELYARIWRGSFPAMALNPKMDRDLFYGSYVQTYVQRDVRDLAQIGDITSFLKFLRSAAARTGQLVNLANMARDCDISQPTAKSWLSILQASGLIYLLEPYSNNLSNRFVKTPKLYFLDTGLCCYLTDWSSPEVLEAGAMSGEILETYVVCELLKSYWHNGKKAPIYFMRNQDKQEIDVVLIQDRTAYPLEIKKSSQPDIRSARNFSKLESPQLAMGPGGIVCLADKFLPITETINFIPVSLL